jgi:anti-sigma regulatory factor (Ser/Thr protein kinase)
VADVDATTVRLEIPPRRDHLALVRLVVSGTLSIERQMAERVEDLLLAVTEACANAIQGQQRLGRDDQIQVSIELGVSGGMDSGRDEVVVTIVDHAGGFEPGDLSPLPPATDPGRLRHESGLGLTLMRGHVDEVRFTPTIDGTAVQLVIRA